MSFWTEDRLAALKRLHIEGLGYTQIAARLGTTRGAISGKCDRLGLVKRSDQAQRGGGYTTARKQKPKRQKFAFGANPSPRQKRAPGESPAHATPQGLPIPLNIPLTETGAKRCKFIHGQDDLCCGHPVQPGFPYCEPHAELCYLPLKKREREAA
jgi:GcrA cell cycle regulator